SVNSLSISSALNVQTTSIAIGLNTGQYSCSIALADANSPSVTLNTITVNLTVNGGSTPGLTVTPVTVNFSAAVSGSLQQTNLTPSRTSGGVLSVSASSSTGWLSYSSQSIGQNLGPGSPATITVFANPTNLTANTYSGSISITIGSQTTAVSVTFVV